MGMAERIKERRKIMGYTQTELGEKIGLQASAIAKYENGRVENIKRSVIANMAKVLDCSPCYLLDWEDSPLIEAENERTSSIPQIITYYNELNEYGKETATEHVRLLTLDEKYTKPDNVISIVKEPEPDYLAPNAAHERTDTEFTEEERVEDDSMLD